MWHKNNGVWWRQWRPTTIKMYYNNNQQVTSHRLLCRSKGITHIPCGSIILGIWKTWSLHLVSLRDSIINHVWPKSSEEEKSSPSFALLPISAFADNNKKRPTLKNTIGAPPPDTSWALTLWQDVFAGTCREVASPDRRYPVIASVCEELSVKLRGQGSYYRWESHHID